VFITQHRTWITPKVGDEPKPRPYLSRPRTWRGRMQVRYDDTKTDTKQVAMHAFVWAPMRVATMGLIACVGTYLYLGHDSFMFSMFGYESESLIEFRVNPPAQANSLNLIGNNKAAYSPVRQLEIVLKDHKEALYAMARERQEATGPKNVIPHGPNMVSEYRPRVG